MDGVVLHLQNVGQLTGMCLMRGCLFSLQNSHRLLRTAHGFRPWPGAGEALPDELHSAWTPASFTMLWKRAASALMRAPKSAMLIGVVSAPPTAKRLRMSAVTKIL